MKKSITIITALATTSLMLAACGNSNAQKNNGTNAKQEKREQKVKVKGNTFRAVYHSKNHTAADPSYKYTLTFNEDGTFEQQVISYDGYPGKFFDSGTYELHNDYVVLTIDHVIEETFASDEAQDQGAKPVSYTVRGDSDSADAPLNGSENKAIRLNLAKDRLIRANGNGSLYPSNGKLKSFSDYEKQESGKVAGTTTADNTDSKVYQVFPNSDGFGNWINKESLDNKAKVQSEGISGFDTKKNFIYVVSVEGNSEKLFAIDADGNVYISKDGKKWTKSDDLTAKYAEYAKQMESNDPFGSQERFKEWMDATNDTDGFKIVTPDDQNINSIKDELSTDNGVKGLYVVNAYNGATMSRSNMRVFGNDGKIYINLGNGWQDSEIEIPSSYDEVTNVINNGSDTSNSEEQIIPTELQGSWKANDGHTFDITGDEIKADGKSMFAGNKIGAALNKHDGKNYWFIGVANSDNGILLRKSSDTTLEFGDPSNGHGGFNPGGHIRETTYHKA